MVRQAATPRAIEPRAQTPHEIQAGDLGMGYCHTCIKALLAAVNMSVDPRPEPQFAVTWAPAIIDVPPIAPGGPGRQTVVTLPSCFGHLSGGSE